MNVKILEQVSEENISIFLIFSEYFSESESMLILNMVMPVVFFLFCPGGNEGRDNNRFIRE